MRRAHSHETAHPQEAAKPPARWHRRRDPPKEHRTTTQPRPATANREQWPIGGKDTPNTPTHSSRGRGRKKKTHEGAARRRGEGGTVSRRPKTKTVSDRHCKATTRHATTTPPATKKETKGEGGGKLHPLEHPHTPTPQAAPQKVTGNESGAHKRPSTPAPKPGKNRRADETQTNTHTHHPARNGGVQAGHTHERTHTQTPQPRVAGHRRNPSPTHTPTPHTPARKDGVQAGRAHKHTHAPTPQPRVAGRGCNPGPSTHPRTAPSARRCRGRGGARTQTRTHPKTSPRGGGAQPKPKPKHTHPHRTPEPGTTGYRQSAQATTHAPKTQPRMVENGPKPKPNRRHGRPQPGKEGQNHNPYPNTPTQDPSEEWRGAADTPAQAQPTPKHQRHATVGNPVSIAWPLRQPVPRTTPGQTRSGARG